MCVVSCKTTAQIKTSYNLVTDFGAVGDNKTNNYKAFQKAAATLSGKKNKTLIIPKGNYYIADYKVIGGPQKNDITDIDFRDINGLTIEGNNSTIRINGKFKRTVDYRMPSVAAGYAYKNSVCPLLFLNCKNVSITNLVLEGGANEMEKEENVAEGICYGIMVVDEIPSQQSGNFSFSNINVRYFATDGIYISSNGANFKMNSIFSSKNGRQGMSLVKGRNFTITNSAFDSTGFTGKYGSHSPAAGIDIENEGTAQQLNDVKIVNCFFRHNIGFQLVSNSNSGNVYIDSCYFEDGKKGYATGFNSVGLYSRNSVLSNSIIYGMLQLETAHETYKGTVPLSIKNNIIYSGMGGLLSSDYQTPMDITGNIIIMLPNPVENQFFPFVRNINANFSDNVIVTHEDKFKVQKSRITALVQGVKQTRNNLWLLSSGSDKKLDRSLKPEPGYYHIGYDGTKTIGKQYYPGNAKTVVAQSPEKYFLDETLIDQLFRRSIFTSYNHYKYDRSLLAEAAAIRDLLIRNMR